MWWEEEIRRKRPKHSMQGAESATGCFFLIPCKKFRHQKSNQMLHKDNEALASDEERMTNLLQKI